MLVRSKVLLKRIARFVKQNQELIDQNENLVRQVTMLTGEVERLKRELTIQADTTKTDPDKSPRPTKTVKYEMATVLFANIHGFNNISGKVDTQSLMDELDSIFMQFESIIEKYNIAKIKTIGDSFMCAGGIPEKNNTNPVQVLMAALEMQYHIRTVKMKNGNAVWELRIGIHTGPVSASIKSYSDIKGDTVNIASRIESTGETGKILISVMTYELVKEMFVCEYYKKMPVKYKGTLDLFSLKGLNPEFSLNGNGLVPNDAFNTKFKLIQFSDLQEIILDRLEKELPSNLYYHNVKHTVDVVTEVELIGWAEGVSDHDILLLKTAALFHDLGHIISYDNHEEEGVKLARQYLPNFHYNEQEMDKIGEIIMATKMPPRPKNKLEEIMCDSDLDYLGRSDFIPVSNTLFSELSERDMIGSLEEWNKLQIKFISSHQYFTKTARVLREVNKRKQIERIKSLLNDGG